MIKAGIVGATGYTGVELLRLLASHPEVQVSIITSRAQQSQPVTDVYPSLRGHYDGLLFSDPDPSKLSQCDVVFFATPHGVAHQMVPSLVKSQALLIDLSADFRLKDPVLWSEWYAQPHGCPELLDSVVYGLAEVNRRAMRQAKIIACPGCYPTAAQLGLLPVLAHDLVDPQSITINAVSGVSGAGRQASIGALLPEASDSTKAYGVSGHRHLPEIEQGLRAVQPEGATPVSATFVPHLVPMIRGIHATIYATIKEDADWQALYETYYQDEPFVDVLPAGICPETRSVKGTNICRVSVLQPQERDTLVVLSAIDNLTKGSSGQAIQAMNIALGLPEDTGLQQVALMP